MKKTIWAALMFLGVFALGYNNSAFAAAETKKVCVEQTDPKTKKVKEVCKDVKVHKKLEGTKVPDKQAK
jgi:hypothetical protein